MEPLSFSFSMKRAHCCTSTQEEMRYEGSQGKAPPLSRRRMTPPTPKQSSNDTRAGAFCGGRSDVEYGRRNKERKQYLVESYCVKVEVEELEDLLGPDDVDVDFQANPKRDKR